ncbi:hypothetical protein ACXN5V_02390 [Weissella confusa]
MDFFRSTVKKQSDSWIFPSGKGLTLSGINAAGIDTFSDVPINSITREGIQNSLDAKDLAVDGPVVVKFQKHDIPSSDIPGIEELRNEALPAMGAAVKIMDRFFRHRKVPLHRKIFKTQISA